MIAAAHSFRLAIRTNHLWRDYPRDAPFLQLFSFMFWALPLALALVHNCAALLCSAHTQTSFILCPRAMFYFPRSMCVRFAAHIDFFFLSHNHRSHHIGCLDSEIRSCNRAKTIESRSVDSCFSCELKIHLKLAKILYNSIISSNWIQHLLPTGVVFFSPCQTFNNSQANEINQSNRAKLCDERERR